MATCTAPTTCGVNCEPGYHACGSAAQIDCFPNTDPASAAIAGDPCILSEALGVFTSPLGSDTTGNGSRTQPYATIGHAMDVAAMGTKRVYACASAGNYAESLTVGASRDGVAVYGALDCSVPATWAYNASMLGTLAPASGYPLQVTGLTAGVTFEDFAFIAQSAPATPPAAGPGASSIAVLVNGASNVAFARGKIVAGNGQPGALAVLSPYSFPSAMQLQGNPGTDAAGGAAVSVLCPDGSTTTGGKGGDPPSGNGAPGMPSLGLGAGGTSLACMADTTGANGADGADGALGSNAPALTVVGAISNTTWQPAAGAPGRPGGPGQGGGGGGASVPAGHVGGGGAGGGAGGCGGAGGGGGTGGGASIAVLAIDAAGLSFQGIALVGGNGGPGGAGVGGQPGQSASGNAGLPLGSGGCPGGFGGIGGAGGAGAGGAGGSSVGLLYSGAMPTLDSQTQSAFQQGLVGSGGVGGAPGANDGIAGAKGLLLPAP
jgi:hypothetical protein